MSYLSLSGSGGGTGFLFTVGAGNTLNFYVETTGSNSNDGLSPATAFADGQFAENYIAANVNFAGGNVIINFGIGSFAGVGVPTFIGGGICQIYGAGSASTTMTGGNNDQILNFGECYGVSALNNTSLGINAITLQPPAGLQGVAIYANAISLGIGDVLNPFSANGDIVHDLSNPSTQAVLNQGVGAAIFNPGTANNAVVKFNATPNKITNVFSCVFSSFIIQSFAYTLQNSVTWDAFVAVLDGGIFLDGGQGYVIGSGTQTGPMLTAAIESHIGGINGTPDELGEGYFPGTTFGFVDSTSSYDGYLFAQPTVSGAPTTTDLPEAGTWATFVDGSGNAYVAQNVAGTIKKVSLV